MRARIPEDRRVGFWKKFRPGRWYPAEMEGDAVRLLDGRRSEVFPRDGVEIRPVPDDEWEIHSLSRVQQEREGQSIDYPGRLAECPRGHRRRIPSRFDAAVVELRCRDCDRAYRLVSR
ncbi:MAG: hypothetical protein ACRELX_18935 [Longimicrobiales bacterium]